MNELVLPRATAGRGFVHPGCEVLPVLGTNALAGLPAYGIAFYLSYAVAGSDAWARHLTFLGLVALFATFIGIVALTLESVRYPESALQILSFGIVTSLAINAAAVGFGWFVSATSKGYPYLTTGHSAGSDALVSLSLFAVVAVFARAAQVLRRPR